MDAILTSTAVVALAEIGDKTMLLAIVLATRFRKPLPIIMGVLVATLVNHGIAAFVGESVADLLEGQWFRYAVGVSFVAMALWTLVPDKLGEDERPKAPRFGAFLTTTIAFFLVEIGDKTQVATIALGAQFQNVVLVTLGTTLGMMLANVPAVYFGNAIVESVPLKLVRIVAALLLLSIGIWVLLGAAGVLKGIGLTAPFHFLNRDYKTTQSAQDAMDGSSPSHGMLRGVELEGEPHDC